MQPLNPFLAAFFRSPLPTQCAPVHHHILLVPTTDVLLTWRETETGASAYDLVVSEDFLASHVLRIPGSAVSNPPGPGGKEAAQNLRDVRGKAKQYSTLNGRTVVIKDAHVYSNKGFKALAQAQLLHDAIWYPDVLEPRQWLIYYISRPLIGSWEEVKITPAVLKEGMSRKLAQEQNTAAVADGPDKAALPRKKDIKSFHDLLNQFPVIARQMQPGLEKLFIEFTNVFERPLPPPPSASSIPDPLPDGPIANAMRKARSNSLSMQGRSNGVNGSAMAPLAHDFYAEDDEDVMRASLETAVTTAIDLFQGVDKQQLSMLGATTDLTGPLVERLIERYVTENVHRLLFPRLAAMKRPYDLELEAKIRQMEFVDLSQLGIGIEGGARVKHDLTIHLGLAVEEFKKMGSAGSPQEMLDLLLSTTKMVTQLRDVTGQGNDCNDQSTKDASSEKPAMTVNADTLVSLLLFVVIRAQVRNLHARLLYIRHFIFIDDVEGGEMGYALSTFEAVLAYLAMDSGGLRRASRRNKALWDAARNGELVELQKIMEPSPDAINYDDDVDETPYSATSMGRPPSSWSFTNGSISRRSSVAASTSDQFSVGSGLAHVFPFQSGSESTSEVDFGMPPPVKRVKRVAMDTRSMSSGSEISFHSQAASFATAGSALEGDISVERLSQTHDSFGESVLMMAVQNERPDILSYLLTLNEYYPIKVVLDDINNEDTTLLSAAIQLGHTELIDIVWEFVLTEGTPREVTQYLAFQDIWGRSCAHYMFHAPSLIAELGGMVPWRQKDKNGQTPLFALCRSYDHSDYQNMVKAGLDAATKSQPDGPPLHLDQHIDNKGNTLLHIVTDAQMVLRILQMCDVDVNATNEKKFTPLMVASKYGRLDMVRTLYVDARVDVAAKELRGLTAVELAKDDEVRNKVDDLALFSMPPGADARITGVVRAYFVEDATIRLVLKSAAPADPTSYTVTTSRRSLNDFERLSNLLALENPASWIPTVAGPRSPFQIPSKPSRSVLRDVQMRADWFVKTMMAHSTFATHEMMWEFILVPDMQLDMMDQRSQLKAVSRTEKVREELEPLENVREVQQFVDHAREMMRSVNYSIKSVARRANAMEVIASDLYDASILLHRVASTLEFLPRMHATALESVVRTLAPSQLSPHVHLHSSLLGIQSTIQALLSALSRPPTLITQITASRKAIERSFNSLNRSSRWPLGLLDDTRQRLNEEKEEKARQSQEQLDDLGRELRYTQQVVAGELAGYHELHEKMGRRAIREYARGMVIQERMRLEGITRALRKLREEVRGPIVRENNAGDEGWRGVSRLRQKPRESVDGASTSASQEGGTSGT